MKNKIYRGHPLQIILYIYKQLIWLLIPLIRGLISAFTSDFITWMQGAWFDWMIFWIIIAVGVLQWYLTTFTYEKKSIILKKGILFRRTVILNNDNIMSVLITRSFYLRPFKAVRLRLDTPGGSYNSSDFNMVISKKTAFALRNFLSKNQKGKKVVYKANFVYILALSIISSNSFAGIMLVTTFISQAGKLLGTQISQRIYGTFQQVANYLAFGIPPAAAALAYILFIGWFVAFTANAIRFRNLIVTRKGDYLDIKGGLATIREYTLKPKTISYIDISQTLLTKILGLYSVFVYAIGYGKDKDDVSAIIPAVRKKELAPTMFQIVPRFNTSPRSIKPNFGAIFRFIADPLYFCFGTVIITAYLIISYYTLKDFIIFIGIMAIIPALWFLAVRLIDCFSSGISKDKECYTIRYSKGFYLHTIVIPKDKITKVKTKQSIFQKMDKKCDVFIYSYSEGISMHRCRNLEKADVLSLFDINF